MKRIALLGVALLALTAGEAHAQRVKKPWSEQLFRPRNENRAVRFGIALSLNVLDFRITNTATPAAVGEHGEEGWYFATVDGLTPGFNVNALVRFRLTDDFHIRMLPGICFGQRDISFYRVMPGNDQNGTLAMQTQLESAYIEMPILFCYQARRISNVRPYFVAGVSPRLDAAAFRKLKVENNQYLQLNRYDLAYEIGFGCEFYFPYFKMAPELKWSASVLPGLSKTVAEGGEAYRAAIKGLTGQGFVFSLIFE